MKKDKARFGQTLADMAIQTKGSIEALVDLAYLNEVSVTEVFEPNQTIELPDKTYNTTIESYVKSRGVSPATGSGGVEGIFTIEFSQEFT